MLLLLLLYHNGTANSTCTSASFKSVYSLSLPSSNVISGTILFSVLQSLSGFSLINSAPALFKMLYSLSDSVLNNSAPDSIPAFMWIRRWLRVITYQCIHFIPYTLNSPPSPISFISFYTSIKVLK